MRTNLLSGFFVALIAGLFVFAGCSSKPASLNELPVYGGATELEAGKSAVGNTMKNNMQTDTAMRNAMGVGGKTEQKGYRLPANATWEGVKAFYDEKLKAAGWASGMPGDQGSKVAGVLDVANQSNPLYKTSVWSKGKQNVSIVMLNNAAASEKDLLVTLNSM